MWNNKSIFNQILLYVSGLTLIFLILSMISLYFSETEDEVKMRNYILAEHAQTLATFLKLDKAGSKNEQLVFDIPETTRKFYDGSSDYEYVVRNKEGKILFTDEGTDASRFPPKWPITDKPNFFEFDDKQKDRFFGSGYARQVGRNTYLVQTVVSKGSAYSFPRNLASTLLTKAFIHSLLRYILLLGVLYLTIRRSLRGLKRVTDGVSKISISSPDYRIDDTDLPEEVHNLAVTFNKMLARLEAGIKSERDFISNAAHELRTPLSIIRCRAEQIKDKAIAGPLLKDIDSVSHLIQQLLDKANLDELKSNNFERLDLRDVVQNVCTDMGPLLIRENRRIEVRGANTPMAVIGNKWALYRALANLIENALKHTPKGTAIDISLHDFSISVRDHGLGIPPKNLEMIFKSFWREDGSKPFSTGLGLAIVKKTMELHGGTVDVKNAREGGAIFALNFPEAASSPLNQTEINISRVA